MAQEKLAFRNIWMKTLEQSLVIGDCPSPPPTIDFNGDNYITLKLTGSEITTLLSALWQGAQITYPDEVYQTVWLFLQGLECNLLCDAIVQNCLTNPAFLASLTSVLLQEGFGQASGGGSDASQPGMLGLSIGDLGAGCTNNQRYGFAYQVADLMNDHAVDMLDVIGVLVNEAEVAGEMVDHAGILGLIPGVALDVAKYMLDMVISTYAVAWNAASHDAIACAIYCEMGGACTLDLETLIDAYESVITVFNPPGTDASFSAIALWLSQQVVTVDDQVVAMYHWLILQLMAHGGSWIDATPRTLEVAASQSNPLAPPAGCDCPPPEWEHTFDFTIDEQGWTAKFIDAPVNDYIAVYVTATGWAQNIPAPTNDSIGIVSPTFSGTCTQIEIFHDQLWGTGNPRTLIRFNVSQVDIVSSGVDSMDLTLNMGTSVFTADEVYINRDGRAGNIASTPGHIIKVILRGTGTDPF